MKKLFKLTLALLGTAAIFMTNAQAQEAETGKKPAVMPEVPEGFQTATFAAGCYWCVEAVFQRIDGVHAVTSGFIGGHVKDPKYDDVVEGTTGHAEAVQLVFNPKKVSYEKLLAWFWKLHDPTTLNRQGADVGTHYRSGIFYHSDAQKNLATASRTAAQKSFPRPIVTELTKATKFYPAKISHQDYYKINGSKDNYCRFVIEPKLEKLKLNK